jgi:DNA-binding CsgD family transcriptional regulator/tetratricopeptide (TPR) repeat protein
MDPHLLERDVELQHIGALLDDAREGRGGVAVVEGMAGAGKSSLVAATRERAAGLRILSASGSEFEREFAFGAIRQLFEPLLAPAKPRERARLLSGAAAPAEWVIAPNGDDTAARAEAGFAVLNAVYWLAANVAQDVPLLLVVDDLHWVDEASVRSLSHLGRRLADLPIALVVALRPDEPGAPAALLDEVRALPGVARVSPRPLSAAAVAKVVRARAARAADELCAACHAASRGNPLYLQELLRTLEADGSLTAPGAAAAVERASVPTLADRVARRIARVSGDAPVLARAMAVLGDGEALRTAADLAELSQEDAATIARELVAIEVLSGDDPFAFVHPLVRRSVYDGLSVTDRDAAHETAARLLAGANAPREAVAAHLAATRPAGSEAVATALLEAAGVAAGRAAPDSAIRLLRRALEENATSPPRATLLFELGKAELALRDITAVATLREALELETDQLVRARIAATLAELFSHAGRWDEMLALLETTRRELGDDADEEAIVEIDAVRAAGLVWTPNLVPIFDRERPRLEALAEGDTWAAHALAALIGCALAYRGEDVDHARTLLERVGRSGVLVAGRGGGAWAGAMLTSGLWAIDELDLSLEFAAEISEAGRRSGSLVAILGGSLFPGLAKARQGDLSGAEADMRTTMAAAVESGMAMWMLTTVHVFVDVLLERPAVDDVRQLMESVQIEESFLDSLSGATLLEPRGRVRVASGDRVGGISDLRRAVMTIRALRIGPMFSTCRSALALALPVSARDEALSLAEEELAIARRAGLPRPEGVALRAVGLLEGGEAGLDHLRESIACLERSPSILEHARSLVELGAALRRRKLRTEARGHLTTGLDLAYRCGAPKLVERAEQELRAAGARPRRRAQSGSAALTASELRVAEMAARGHTNVEIAQQLFVSAKTVETHLSSSYRKLGLAGQGARSQLPAVLAA